MPPRIVAQVGDLHAGRGGVGLVALGQRDEQIGLGAAGKLTDVVLERGEHLLGVGVGEPLVLYVSAQHVLALDGVLGQSQHADHARRVAARAGHLQALRLAGLALEEQLGVDRAEARLEVVAVVLGGPLEAQLLEELWVGLTGLGLRQAGDDGGELGLVADAAVLHRGGDGQLLVAGEQRVGLGVVEPLGFRGLHAAGHRVGHPAVEVLPGLLGEQRAHHPDVGAAQRVQHRGPVVEAEARGVPFQASSGRASPSCTLARPGSAGAGAPSGATIRSDGAGAGGASVGTASAGLGSSETWWTSPGTGATIGAWSTWIWVGLTSPGSSSTDGGAVGAGAGGGAGASDADSGGATTSGGAGCNTGSIHGSATNDSASAGGANPRRRGPPCRRRATTGPSSRARAWPEAGSRDRAAADRRRRSRSSSDDARRAIHSALTVSDVSLVTFQPVLHRAPMPWYVSIGIRYRLSRINRSATMPDVLRGTLDLMILQSLELAPRHGTAIAERLAQVTGGAVEVGPGSLFPALYRLEHKGWLRGSWGQTERGHRARIPSSRPQGGAGWASRRRTGTPSRWR